MEYKDDIFLNDNSMSPLKIHKKEPLDEQDAEEQEQTLINGDESEEKSSIAVTEVNHEENFL